MVNNHRKTKTSQIPVVKWRLEVSDVVELCATRGEQAMDRWHVTVSKGTWWMNDLPPAWSTCLIGFYFCSWGYEKWRHSWGTVTTLIYFLINYRKDVINSHFNQLICSVNKVLLFFLTEYVFNHKVAISLILKQSTLLFISNFLKCNKEVGPTLLYRIRFL